MPFKPEFKVRLLEALRSNRYVQGFERLRRHDNGCTQHCIMGVIADLHDPTRWCDQELKGKSPSWLQRGDKYGPFEAILEDLILDEIGLTGNDQCVLVDLNDNRFDFPRIADYIEEKL